MKLKLKLISILLMLVAIFVASQGSTFKPFIRSRYSIRWRKTTEAPNVWYSSTASVKEGVEKISAKPTEMSDSFTDNSAQLTTGKSLLKTSTHSTDYDYYNNEVEEGEHRN